MLDEIKEFNEYLYDIMNDPDPARRIKYNTLMKRQKDKNGVKICSFDGLDRFLTTITRGILFGIDSPEQSEKSLSKAEIMRAFSVSGQKLWMGAKKNIYDFTEVQASAEIENTYEYISGWLESYMRNILLRSKIEETRSALQKLEIEESLAIELERDLTGVMLEPDPAKAEKTAVHIVELCRENKVKLHNTPEECILTILQCMQNIPAKCRSLGNEMNGTSGYKVLTYKSVAMRANQMKALKRYAMCCRSPYFEDIVKKTEDKNCVKTKIYKISEKDKDKILKMTAACLLEMNRLPGSHRNKLFPVAVNYIDITNWTVTSGILQGTHFRNFIYNKEPLFETDARGKGENGSGNQAVAKINEAWYEKCEWNLLDISQGEEPIEEYLAMHPGYQVYLDAGSGRELKLYKSSR